MSANVTGFAYLIAAVCFIMALRGLSSPESARKGNLYGMIGMVIAVVTALIDPTVVSFGMIVLGVLIGGSIGTVVALRIQMTALPQLVAAFHSLVGLAAVFVAAAALYHPEAYGIGTVGAIKPSSLIEMSLGMAIGAITFSGSVIAWAKLQGTMTGNPIVFPGQHPLNAVLGIVMVLVIVWFAPNTQEIMARHAPALDAPAALAADISRPWRVRLERWREALEARRVYVLIPLVSGSAVLAGIVALSRGAMSNQFIYMIF